MGGGVWIWKYLMKEVKVETSCEGKNSTRKTKGTGASRPQKQRVESPGHFQETARGMSKVMATCRAQGRGPLVCYYHSRQSAI